MSSINRTSRYEFEGSKLLTIDDTNDQVTIGKTSETYPFLINSTDASDSIQIYHNNTDVYFKWNDGSLYLETDEGTNTNTEVKIVGKGTGVGTFECYDQDNAEYLRASASSGSAALRVAGAAPVAFSIQDVADVPIRMFEFAAEGETQELQIHGYRTGDSNRSLQIGVGVDAADTASFDGLSNYRFDGTVRANTAFDCNGNTGLSGTMTLDDGANWRVTQTFTGGILSEQTIAASSAATATWT